MTNYSRIKTLRIAHLFPELLNLYGDSGNILVLKQRLQWRSLACEIIPFHVGDTIKLQGIDIIFIGGGSDREQKIVCDNLFTLKDEIKAYVEDGGVFVAVCGGYQLLGDSYLVGKEKLRGLGILDLTTEAGNPRLIGDIAISSSLCKDPIVGYENHSGRTYLGSCVQPLGRVIAGNGNNGHTNDEGCFYKNLIGTYIHGPLLPKNPQLADYLLKQALDRKYGIEELSVLDDTEELNANKFIYRRILAAEK